MEEKELDYSILRDGTPLRLIDNGLVFAIKRGKKEIYTTLQKYCAEEYYEIYKKAWNDAIDSMEELKNE